jgi:signal transduction histidine kinase
VRSAVPAELTQHFPPNNGLVIDNDAGRAWLARTLRVEGFSAGRILAEIDITELLRVRRQVLLTLVLVNAGLTVAFAAFGYLALKRMLQPLGVLTSYVERAREGRVEPIPEGNRRKIAAEFRQVFDRFNAMARALSERESLASRLAEQEKYAVLGKLASGMAHEVNNPLGGLFNALDTLRRHGGDPNVRESSLSLLQRGLTHIRNVVRSSLVIYRRQPSNDSAGAADIDDLRLLVEPEAARKNINLDWENEVRGKLPVAAGSMRQATLNLLINACAAAPSGGAVKLRAIEGNNSLIIEIGDDGPGLPQALAKYLVAETDDTAPAGDGLGLWIVRRLVADEGGSIRVACAGDAGTLIRVTWPFRNDRSLQKGQDALSGEDMIHVG